MFSLLFFIHESQREQGLSATKMTQKHHKISPNDFSDRFARSQFHSMEKSSEKNLREYLSMEEKMSSRFTLKCGGVN